MSTDIKKVNKAVAAALVGSGYGFPPPPDSPGLEFLENEILELLPQISEAMLASDRASEAVKWQQLFCLAIQRVTSFVCSEEAVIVFQPGHGLIDEDGAETSTQWCFMGPMKSIREEEDNSDE